MSRERKEPLRDITEEEREVLVQIARSQSEPAVHVAPAKSLLGVAAGRKSNDAVAHPVRQFNQGSLAALAVRHAGGARWCTN